MFGRKNTQQYHGASQHLGRLYEQQARHPERDYSAQIAQAEAACDALDPWADQRTYDDRGFAYPLGSNLGSHRPDGHDLYGE